jgi:hypothetical protein
LSTELPAAAEVEAVAVAVAEVEAVAVAVAVAEAAEIVGLAEEVGVAGEEQIDWQN